MDQPVQLSSKKIKSLIKDTVKTANAINLVYVTDKEKGISRIKRGTGFYYYIANKKVRKKPDLDRIKNLVIPPAWKNVWICVLANGHLQATGIDIKNRKQYRYHEKWNNLRNQTKFYNLYEFGKALPSIRDHLEKDLSLQGLPLEKVLATVVSLMERTNIRIGSSLYEKLYGSYGLTTLKDKHVSLIGKQMAFSFKGKKGVEHTITLKSKRLAGIVQKCRDIPGKELFQYYTENGKKDTIDSGMVNDYIKKISGGDFTAKDFRTWAGTVNAIIAFKELGCFETEGDAKIKIAEAFKMVSAKLGNSANVCKKYYVHPAIIELYETKKLNRYISQLNRIESNQGKTGLTAEEKIVLKILQPK